MTMLYLNQSYNEVYYKGRALYFGENFHNPEFRIFSSSEQKA